MGRAGGAEAAARVPLCLFLPSASGPLPAPAIFGWRAERGGDGAPRALEQEPGRRSSQVGVATANRRPTGRGSAVDGEARRPRWLRTAGWAAADRLAHLHHGEGSGLEPMTWPHALDWSVWAVPAQSSSP
jgi:hypothetical protein